MGAVQCEVDRDGERVTIEQIRQSQVSHQEALHMTQPTLRRGPAKSWGKEKGEARIHLVVTIKSLHKLWVQYQYTM